MATKLEQVRFVCRVHIPASSRDPRFEWQAGQGSRKAAIRDAVFSALREAAADPERFPSIQEARPGELHLEVSGRSIGNDDLARLLPFLEEAATREGQSVSKRIGAITVEAEWQKSLDSANGFMAERWQSEEALADVTDSSTNAAARLQKLTKRILPKISKADVAELEKILRDAQDNRPKDTATLVSRVNMLLDVFSLRLKTEDGETGRLTLNTDGSLKITRASGGTRGFKNATISLIGVERVRVGNRFTSPDSGMTR